MAKDEAYKNAERLIAKAWRTGATDLDLGNEIENKTALKLTEIPESLGELTQLENLRLQYNNLTELPEFLSQLTNLEALDLAGNQLTKLPKSLSRLTQLSSLILDDNPLENLPEWIRGLTQLNLLGLSNTRLNEIPAWLGELTNLTLLSLGYNDFLELPDSLNQLTQLEILYLEGTLLTTLPEWIGQLTQLERLYIRHTPITTLPESLKNLTFLEELDATYCQLRLVPEWLGQLMWLELLFFEGNPLPTEILRLDKERKLISYLRELAQQKDAAPRLFNEAKLLLIGPGEVGKTWLLQALQGKKPQAGNSSTKGIEIAREPLDLPHPIEKERTLHFNCWDFGGQEHYQITHQIFFSPKAIYLLVWKPRPGADPDLVTRLERIQLSAGQTAKVFIVSTHAEGNVPAVIGQEALRERFSDLIEGFYEVDSADGPKGKGIAELQAAIARAAAQLEGMDTPYPASWHIAQSTARETKKPTITFREFSALCIAKGVSADNCEGLASVMDVLGNAVFFGDAPQSNEVDVKAEENLVVLDPEWLAKAVTFVLEDQKTRDDSGILEHSRLKTIWRKDTRRDCPGYKRNLFGYLLWMMWKFDIAYKQNDQTSLVPEMIHRNRPDDLQWTPADKAHDERQATLICKIPQDPPAGLIPALTAAVHPLRRIQDLGSSNDRLDRNWREGFFLDTARRGSAFVELVDRDLQIVVRHSYPRDLCKQIRLTLDRIKNDRWPRLSLDYCVPCYVCVDKKLERPGTFEWGFLNEWQGKTVPCQRCRSKDVEVDKLLEGFNAYKAEIMQQLRELKIGQDDLMVQALSFFRAALDPNRAELERAPNMFTILPADVSNWNLWSKATEKKVNVTCWCEHPDGPHPATNFELTSPQDWLVKAAPYITWATVLLKAFVPYAGSIAEISLNETLPADLKDQIKLMGDATKALPSGKLELGAKNDLESIQGQQPEIVALRHIHDTLLAQVSESKRWGNLRPVRTKSNQLLWLCAEHAALQQPPVPQI